MTPPTYLVEPAWLAEHLHDPNIVVIDCRFSLQQPQLGRLQYEAGHIPGAYYLDLNQDLSGPVEAHGGRHPLPDLDRLAQTLGSIGIASTSPSGPTQVVVYDSSRYAFAARLWWLLKYLGHDAVAVLDGGLSAWQQQGYSLSQALPPVDPARMQSFRAQPQPDWLIDIETLRGRQQQPGLLLIDAREPARYRGEQEPIDPVAGSIPGAVNYFWQLVSSEDGRMRLPEVLAEHWAALDYAEESIVYCGSGVTACVNLLAQAIAGKPMSKLYVGGWSDWCSYL